MTEETEYAYIIGLGNAEDWAAGRGSLYYIEDKTGEKGMPVFTTREQLESFVEANFDTPEAHMQMLESLPASHVGALTESRYAIMPLKWEDVARAALMAGVDHVVRDPRWGSEQEIIRVPKDPGP